VNLAYQPQAQCPPTPEVPVSKSQIGVPFQSVNFCHFHIHSSKPAALRTDSRYKSFRINTYSSLRSVDSKQLTEYLNPLDATLAKNIGGGLPRLLPALRHLALLAILIVAPSFASAQSSNAGPQDAIALEQQGKLAGAERVWLSVIARNPRDAAAYASLGVDYSKEQKYPEAASTYRKALALDPKLPGIQLNLGLAEFKQGHFAAAIAPLQAAVEADPSSMQALTLLGLSCYGAARFAEAAEHLAVAAKADPSNTELHQVLAQSCLWAKKYSCALDEFQHIVQQNPNSPGAHMLMGEALDGLARTPEAVTEFEEAAKAGPREPNVHFGLGYLRWELKQYDEAATEFKTELSIAPDNAQASAYLGDIDMKKNDPASAIPLLKKALQSNSGIRIAWLDMGIILAQQGHTQEAIIHLKHAVKLDPERPDAHFRLGRIYESMGSQAAAQKEFDKVRALHEKAEEDVGRKMGTAPPPLPQ
jgi:tetratricopeptide (TPR) repeat protein